MHHDSPEIPGLEEVCRAVEDARAELRERGGRRRYSVWRHAIVRSLSSMIVLVYLVAMGFLAAPRWGRVFATLRDWWRLLWCAWAAGPLLLAEIGVINPHEPRRWSADPANPFRALLASDVAELLPDTPRPTIDHTGPGR